jgi:hypothetical protein
MPLWIGVDGEEERRRRGIVVPKSWSGRDFRVFWASTLALESLLTIEKDGFFGELEQSIQNWQFLASNMFDTNDWKV